MCMSLIKQLIIQILVCELRQYKSLVNILRVFPRVGMVFMLAGRQEEGINFY